MRKLLFICLFFIIAFSIFAGEDNNLVIVKSGEDKVAEFRDAKSISVFITFNDTKMWAEDKTLDEYLEARKRRGDRAKEDKVKIIKEFYKIFDKKTKKGKKWGLTRVENVNDVNDGYLIMLNYDKCIPIPGVGAQGYATISIYLASDQKTPIITGEIKCLSIAKSIKSLNPEFQFSELAQRFVGELVDFLKGKK